MGKVKYNWTVLLAFFLGMLIIYENGGIHPLWGFLTAFTLSWLTFEDWADRLVDMRMAMCFLASILLWQKPVLYTLLLVVCFAAFFEIFRHLLARFVPRAEVSREEAEDDCALQDGATCGFVPLLSGAIGILYLIDMVFYPLGYGREAFEKGINGAASYLWESHLHVLGLHEYVTENIWIMWALAVASVLAVAVLWIRTRRKRQAGLVPLYPMGDGDPLVLGALGGMLGAEVFWFGVLPLSIIIGECCRRYCRRQKADASLGNQPS